MSQSITDLAQLLSISLSIGLDISIIKSLRPLLKPPAVWINLRDSYIQSLSINKSSQMSSIIERSNFDSLIRGLRLVQSLLSFSITSLSQGLLLNVSSCIFSILGQQIITKLNLNRNLDYCICCRVSCFVVAKVQRCNSPRECIATIQ